VTKCKFQFLGPVRITVAYQRHPQRVAVLCALSSVGVFGSVFVNVQSLLIFTSSLLSVPASPEFDSGQGTRDGRELDVWRLFKFIC
jgi:hypothetical protein